jgi:hypothetical protein
MGIIAKNKGGGDFPPVTAGPYQAVCYAVIQIGTQPSNNSLYPAREKVILIWEIPLQRIDIDKDGVRKNLPRAISNEYTLSLSDKSNLRPDLESWRGKAFTAEELDPKKGGFDVSKVAGANCTLNIVHKAKGPKTYANVQSIMPIIPPMKKLKPENPVLVFSLEDFLKSGATALPTAIPSWIQQKIMASNEWIADQEGSGHQPEQGHQAGEPSGAQSGDGEEAPPF